MVLILNKENVSMDKNSNETEQDTPTSERRDVPTSQRLDKPTSERRDTPTLQTGDTPTSQRRDMPTEPPMEFISSPRPIPNQPEIMHPALNLDSGVVIDNRYRVKSAMPDNGAQADMFICEDNFNNKQNVVVKLYRQKIEPNLEIMNKLKRIRHRNLISLLDYGKWNNRFYEVMQYAEGGSLIQYRPYSEGEIKNIVPQIAEGLKTLHEAGILHRDLKPGNLLYADKSRTNVMISDFGISSNLSGNESWVQVSARRTYMYSAPETFDEEREYHKLSDYYSMGITLMVLLGQKKCQEKFEKRSEQAVVKMHTTHRVQAFIQENIDCSPNFKKMLMGLVTGRLEKRWGYEELLRHLNNEDVPVFLDEPVRQTYSHQTPADPETMISYSFGDRKFNNVADLGRAMMINPVEAKKHIQQRLLYDYFKGRDQSLAVKINDAVEKNRTIDAMLTEIVYLFNPNLPIIFGHDQVDSTKHLAEKMLESPEIAQPFIINGILEATLRHFPMGEKMIKQINEIIGRQSANPHLAVIEVIHLLNPDIPISFNNIPVRTIEELAERMFQNSALAKSFIASGELEARLRHFSPEWADKVREIVQRNGSNQELAYIEIVYSFNPKLPYRLI